MAEATDDVVDPRGFRLAYVPGVTPTKWVRIWTERVPDIPLELVAVAAADGGGPLRAGNADIGLLRLPIDRDEMSVIPLYAETSVVVVPTDHLIAAVDEITADDLAGEVVLHPLDDTLEWQRLPGEPAVDRPATAADAIELVAAGVGVVVVPQSLARLHHRRDLTYRTVTDAPQSRIGLAWLSDATTDLVEEFIGIVRGRTANSSRGRQSDPANASGTTTAAKAAGGRTARAGKGVRPRSGGRSSRRGGGGRSRRSR